jgi:hypothetical protein
MSDMNTVPQPNDEPVFRQELFIPRQNDEVKAKEYDQNGNLIRKNHSYFIGAYDKESRKFVVKEQLERTKSYISKSPISGYGVFAKEDIKSGEIIEECPVVILDGTHSNNTDWVLNRYAFTWGCSCEICRTNGQSMCFPMGNGMVYNHADSPNAYYIQDSFYRLFRFYAFRDIKKDEEITWYYGPGYSERLKNEKKMTAPGIIPEGIFPELRPAPKRNGCGCGAKTNPVDVPSVPVIVETTEVKSADELLFRSMVVPENILNDKV